MTAHPTPETAIRQAESRDIPDMVGLLSQLFALEQDFAPDPARQARGLALLLADRCQCRVLVAESQGRVAGMCVGQLLVSTAEGGPSVLVEDVVVDAGCRGLGLGRLLVQALAVWARDCGASRMQLLADRTNEAALAFYHRLGWSGTRMICLRHHL